MKADEKTLSYTYQSKDFVIPYSELRVIGELVTDAGPDEEDHFVILVCADGSWHQLPFMEVVDSPLLVRRLEEVFGVKIQAKIANVVGFSSIVHAPKQFCDTPLFDISVQAPEKKKMLEWGPSRGDVKIELSTSIRAFLKTG